MSSAEQTRQARLRYLYLGRTGEWVESEDAPVESRLGDDPSCGDTCGLGSVPWLGERSVGDKAVAGEAVAGEAVAGVVGIESGFKELSE